LKTSKDKAGKRARCPACGKVLLVPKEEKQSAAGQLDILKRFRCVYCGNTYSIDQIFNYQNEVICKQCFYEQSPGPNWFKRAVVFSMVVGALVVGMCLLYMFVLDDENTAGSRAYASEPNAAEADVVTTLAAQCRPPTNNASVETTQRLGKSPTNGRDESPPTKQEAAREHRSESTVNRLPQLAGPAATENSSGLKETTPEVTSKNEPDSSSRTDQAQLGTRQTSRDLDKVKNGRTTRQACLKDGTLVPIQTELTTLAPRISTVRLEDKIEEKLLLGGRRAVGAKDGYKLVVVTLQATSPSEAYYVYTTDSFFLLYEYEDTAGIWQAWGDKHLELSFAPICAVSFGGQGWAIRPENGNWTVTQRVSAGPLTIEIAAVVPDKAKRCLVMLATLAAGEGTIPRGPRPWRKKTSHRPRESRQQREKRAIAETDRSAPRTCRSKWSLLIAGDKVTLHGHACLWGRYN
jgi:hypothetical protein